MNVMRIFTLILIVGLCTTIQAMFVSNERQLLNENISAQAYLNNIAEDKANWGEYSSMMQIIRDTNYQFFDNDYYKTLVNRLSELSKLVNTKPNPELYLRELTKTLIQNTMDRITGNAIDPIAEGQLVYNQISPEYYLKLIENNPYKWGTYSDKIRKIRLANYIRMPENLYQSLIQFIKDNIREMQRFYPYKKTETSQIGSLESKILENIDDTYDILEDYKEQDIFRGG
jgi:hypothetical protein